MPAWKLPFVVKSFTSLMKQHAASISLFEHIDDLLLYLANNGVTLAIVSSNSYDNVSQILGPANAKLISQFECGMSMFGKPARIQKVLRKTDIPCREAIYIGDQAADLKAARKEQVAFGAVSWGYETIESLRAHFLKRSSIVFPPSEESPSYRSTGCDASFVPEKIFRLMRGKKAGTLVSS